MIGNGGLTGGSPPTSTWGGVGICGVTYSNSTCNTVIVVVPSGYSHCSTEYPGTMPLQLIPCFRPPRPRHPLWYFTERFSCALFDRDYWPLSSSLVARAPPGELPRATVLRLARTNLARAPPENLT